MEINLLLLIVLLTLNINYGQTSSTTPVDNKTLTTEVKTTEKTTATGKPEETVVKQTTTTTTNTGKETAESKCALKCPITDNNLVIFLLCMLPIAFYIFLVLYISIILNKGGYKLSEALKENFTIQVPTEADKTITTAEQPKSSSRLMAFISAMVTLCLATCFTSFWIYGYLQTGTPPVLESLSNVLLSLGLGIIPYAFNKLSSAVNGK